MNDDLTGLPNCKIKFKKTRSGVCIAVIVAQMDIPQGTPLTLAYGSGYWSYMLRHYRFDANAIENIQRHVELFLDSDDDSSI